MIRYKSGYKYQLHQSYTIDIPWLSGFSGYDDDFIKINGESLEIDRGYAWDGASGPTWDSAASIRASLVHDALYQLMRCGVIPEKCRENADNMLYSLCVEDGMFRPRAWVWWKAVRLAAGRAAHAGTEREVLSAP